MKKYAIGNKVVPISKTVDGYSGLHTSAMWTRAKEANQPFLYITSINPKYGDYSAGVTMISGDYFMEDDFVPYNEKFEEGEIVLVKNTLEDDWVERIYVTETVKNKTYICVTDSIDSCNAKSYNNAERYSVVNWNYISKLEKIKNVVINKTYTAQISKGSIVVGCQTIPIEKVKEILDEYNKINK